MNSNISYSKEVKIRNDYDLIVVGAGPAGIAAVTSSARSGARTALVERFGIIGGNLTAGHVGPIMGTVSSGTIADEINEGLGVPNGGIMHNIEGAKKYLIELLADAGVELFLQSPVIDVIKENSIVKGVIIGTSSEIEALTAKVVIDATGNGTVSYLAGAKYEMGRQEDGLLQPTTLMFTVSGVDESKGIICRHEEDESIINGKSYLDLCKKACSQGILPENVDIVRLYPTVRPGERMVNASQANYIDGLKSSSVFEAELELRKQNQQILDFMRNNIPGFEDCYIKDSADTLGVRETRRIIGEHVLNSRDMSTGKRYDDVIVHKAFFPYDIHNPDGPGQAEGDSVPDRPEAYDIPYRCLVPLTVENLLTTGRCISGTHRAHSSYRVMNIAMALGQAAGTAGALAVKHEIAPRKLDYKKIQESLLAAGVNLFN